ncbi:hypothetical protein Pmani_016379 [Petrolisthes manimaculis]|uniref:Uncharacterized protein n=1 Tax=Petrolisthes manimaculis TaxID=1843537 RepID=A0AAE1PP10_9EUCA|nr:hypothetical protein Pmani_016379 [Petrolisthes manimaculis]
MDINRWGSSQLGGLELRDDGVVMGRGYDDGVVTLSRSGPGTRSTGAKSLVKYVCRLDGGGGGGSRRSPGHQTS